MILKKGFLSDFIAAIKSKFYANIVHGVTDYEQYYRMIYIVECFHNGALNYNNFVKKISKNCGTTYECINTLLSPFIKF